MFKREIEDLEKCIDNLNYILNRCHTFDIHIFDLDENNNRIPRDLFTIQKDFINKYKLFKKIDSEEYRCVPVFSEEIKKEMSEEVKKEIKERYGIDI